MQYWWGLLVLLSNPWIFRLSLPIQGSSCLKSLRASGLSWGHAVASGDYILWHVYGFIKSTYWCVGMHVLRWTVTCTRRNALGTSLTTTHIAFFSSLLSVSLVCIELGICRVVQLCSPQASAEFRSVGVYDSLCSGERKRHKNSQNHNVRVVSHVETWYDAYITDQHTDFTKRVLFSWRI